LPRLARRRSDGGADRAAARTEWGGPKPGLCTLRSGEGTKWSASLRPATPPYHGHSRPQRRFTRGRAWQGFARRSAVREGRGLARVIPQALLLDAPWTWPARLRRCAGVSARARANIAGGTSSSSPRPERTGSRQRSSRSPTSTTRGSAGGLVDDQRECSTRGGAVATARSSTITGWCRVAGHRGTHPGERERADGGKHG
jgi:hypothetical protein